MSTLYRVSVRVAAADAELAFARLIELAPSGFEHVEHGGLVELAVFGDHALRDAVASAFGAVESRPVDVGWEDAWRAFHHPVRAGGVWIGPPWETPPAGGLHVVIDPGRAFGTGAHPTTRATLELLSRCARGSLLDIGSGSGVLAIAAARLGFGPVTAIDDDPVALETAIANARVNGVVLEASVADATEGALPATDVAVVNILLPTVEAVAPHLRSHTIVTSGYLAGERPRLGAYRELEALELEGWAAHRFERLAG